MPSTELSSRGRRGPSRQPSSGRDRADGDGQTAAATALTCRTTSTASAAATLIKVINRPCRIRHPLPHIGFSDSAASDGEQRNASILFVRRGGGGGGGGLGGQRFRSLTRALTPRDHHSHAHSRAPGQERRRTPRRLAHATRRPDTAGHRARGQGTSSRHPCDSESC